MGMKARPDVLLKALELAGVNPVAGLSERDFQAAVVSLAKANDWWCFHDSDSRRNEAGLPDLILLKDGRLIWAELKSRRGKVRPAQAVVLGLLEGVAARCNGVVSVHVWRPEQWAEIVRELTRK